MAEIVKVNNKKLMTVSAYKEITAEIVGQALKLHLLYGGILIILFHIS